MIDSHAHIYSEEFDEDIDAVIQRAMQTGVTKILMPNIDGSSIQVMNDLAEKYPNVCLPMIGLHPCYVKEDYQQQLARVAQELDRSTYIAVGEIGTDLYWDKTYWEQQQEAFRSQAQLALEHKLPIVIHCRESIDETIELVTPFARKGLGGVFHCFTGTLDQANKIIDLGFYLGLGGVVTFKNGGMDQVIPHLDIHKILLETDSPYLAPTPLRGKRNEPAFLSHIMDKVSGYMGLSGAELDQVTTANAHKLFNLK